MRVDILCQGDWQDSYESRMLGEMVWNREISSFSELMTLIQYYFSTDQGKREQELFADFDIYIECTNVGRYSKGEITIDPIIDMNKDCTGGYFRHGHHGYIINIADAMKYGLNHKSVRIDTTHKWC